MPDPADIPVWAAWKDAPEAVRRAFSLVRKDAHDLAVVHVALSKSVVSRVITADVLAEAMHDAGATGCDCDNWCHCRFHDDIVSDAEKVHALLVAWSL